MPWGKYRGVRISLLPDSYVSFLTTTVIISDPKWDWLKESLLAELRFRGLRTEGVEDDLGEPSTEVLQAVVPAPARRRYNL
jgi:hypothetical protein